MISWEEDDHGPLNRTKRITVTEDCEWVKAKTMLMYYPCIRVVESNIMGADKGGELIFRAALHKRLPGGRERTIITTEEIRPAQEEERIRRLTRCGPDRKWWLLMTIISLSMIGMGEAKENALIKIVETQGSFHYHDEGGLYTKAGTGTVKIDLECGELIDGLKTFNKVATKCGGIAKWVAMSSDHDIVNLENGIEFFSTSESEIIEDRIKKSILADAYNFFTGMWNKARISDIETRLDHQEHAQRLEVQETEGIREYVNEVWQKTNKSEELLAKAIEMVGVRSAKEHVQRQITEEFTYINSNASAVTAILRAATSHKIDPALADVVDFPQVWTELGEKLKEKNYELPSETWQHVFTLDCDVFAKQRKVTIAIHVPTKPAKAKRMSVHRWIPSPIMVQKNLLVIEGEQRTFATDDNGGVAVVGPAADCLRYGQDLFCRGPMVIERKGFHMTCVAAVWNMDIRDMQQLCDMKLIPKRQMVIPVTSRMFQIVTVEKMAIRVDCDDGRTDTKEVARGMYEVKTAPACDVQTPLWDGIEGQGIAAQVTMVKHAKGDLTELATVLNGTWKEDQTNIVEQINSVEEPTPVASMRDRINGDLDARGSATKRFYIIIAVITVVGIAAAAGMMFLMWRGRRLQALVQGVMPGGQERQQEIERRESDVEEPPPGMQQEVRLQEEEERRERERERREDESRRDMLRQLEETLERAEARMAYMQPEEAENHRMQVANSLNKVKTGIEKVWFRQKAVNGEDGAKGIPKMQEQFMGPDIADGLVITDPVSVI